MRHKDKFNEWLWQHQKLGQVFDMYIGFQWADSFNWLDRRQFEREGIVQNSKMFSMPKPAFDWMLGS